MNNNLTIILKWLWLCVIWLGFVAWTPFADAATFSKAELNDEQFLLLDIKNKKLLFLESIDAYAIDGQVLLPLGSLLQSLELNFVVSVTDATLKLTQNGATIDIDFQNPNPQGPFASSGQMFYWSNAEDELLVSHLLIEILLKAKLNVNQSQLAVIIDNAKALFPVEQRLAREDKRKKAIQPLPGGVPDDVGKTVFADEFILDTYRLYSAPSANVSLNVISTGGESSETKFASRVQSDFDFLHHYAELTLNKQTGDNIATNLTFNRHQASPYETFLLGIKRYSFGDVFGKADNLGIGNQSGVGLSVARRPVNYSRKFGRVTLEDMATPGWEIELYRGGVLLQTGKVPDNGRYVFEDVETLFGVNRFEIKLYGPYGEEEVHHKNIRINSTQLKVGEYGFNSYIMDAGNKLLEGVNGQSSGFDPDFYGFAWDYGLADNLTLGFSLTQKKNTQNQNQQIVGTEIQTSIPGALFDLSVSHEVGEGYAALASVVGRLWGSTTYQLNYQTSNNFQLADSNFDRDLFVASMSGVVAKIGYTNAASFSSDNQTDVTNLTNRLSGRLGKLKLTHNLTYRDTQLNNQPNLQVTEILTGDFSVAGRVTPDIRLSGSLNYDLKDNAKIDIFRLSTSVRLTEKINLNNQLEYLLNSATKWRLSGSLAWSAKKSTFSSSLSYDANDQWSVNLGLTFSIGYDHNNDSWMINSKNYSTSGTLDINSYLDQNNNHQLDEGDVALPGVKFGHSKQWEGIVSNQRGKTTLPFISTFAPTPISPTWVAGVEPATASYSVYTHPGSRISAQIPFTVRTTISGFTILDDADGEPLSNINILLKNNQNTTVKQTLTDDDGYFEFIDIDPGKYNVIIDPAALTSQTLVSDPGSLQFSTMPAGGYLELGVITAIPASQTVKESVRIVKATIDNYEPVEEVEQLLGLNSFADQGAQETITSPIETNVATVTGLKAVEDDTLADDEANIPKVATGALVLKSTRVLSPQQTSQIKAKVQLKRSSVQSPNTKSTLPTVAIDPAGSTQFALQFAVFSTANLANNLISTLKTSGVAASRYFDQKIMAYRVLQGPFNTQAQAENKSSQLKSQGIDNFTRNWSKPLVQLPSPLQQTTRVSNELPSNGFSIQMMVARTQKSIDDVLGNPLLGTDLYQIKKRSQGGALNVLLKGHYATRAQAQQVVSRLPVQWRNKTWIRAVSDLQAEQIN